MEARWNTTEPVQSGYQHYNLRRAGPKNFDRFLYRDFDKPRLSTFDFASPPVRDIFQLDLDDIIAIEVVGEGTEEETERGSFTIQPTKNPCQNLFAYYLFKQLKVHVPMTKVLGFHQREYKQVVWRIESATYQNPNNQTRILGIINKPYWMVRQYKPFLPLDKIRNENAKEGNPKAVTIEVDNQDGLLRSEDIINPQRTLDFDALLILNSKVDTVDRMKSSDNNLLFSTYITQVETVLESCCLHLRDIMMAKVTPLSQSDYHFEILNPIRHFITQATGYEPTTMAEFQLLLGIVIGMQMIVRMGMELLNRMLQFLNNPKDPDPKGLWKNDANMIKPDFFRDILGRVDRILLRFDDVLAYSHSVTVGQFSLQFGADLRAEVLKEMRNWTNTEILPKATDEEVSLEKKEAEYRKFLLDREKQADEVRKEAEQILAKQAQIERQSRDDQNKGRKVGYAGIVGFDDIDRKLEEVFGFKMDEFIKGANDEDILQKSFAKDESEIKSPISRQGEKEPANSTVQDLANDLLSRKTGKTGGSKSKAVSSKKPKTGK